MRRRALLASTASASVAAATAGCVGTLQSPVDVRTYDAGNNIVYDPGIALVVDTVGMGSQHETVVVGDRDDVANPEKNRRHTVFFVNAGAARRIEFSIHVDGYEVYARDAEYGVDDWQVVGFLEPADYVLRLENPAGAHAADVPRDAFREEPSKRTVLLDSDGVDART